MGLKSGSRDAGLDDEETEDQSEHDEPTDGDAAEDQTEQSTSDTEQSAQEEPTESSSGSNRPSRSSLPYKLRREKVNEGREQVPYFLREEIIKGEDALQTTLEDLLGEKVYKSDYREAAMVVAQRNPELIADILREWGYDLD